MKLLNTYSNEAEAYIDKGMLASAGIKTIIVYNALSDVFPAPDAGTTEIALYVDDPDFGRAVEMLKSRPAK